MIQKESDLILLGALRHTPGTRANYFINEAKKAGISNETLLAELENSYLQFYKIVTHPKSDEWGVNEDGSHEPLYHWVNLYDYIGTPGTLHKGNISELLDIIKDFRSCLPKDAPAKDQEPAPGKNFIDYLVMDENKKQPFADQLKSKYSDLTGKDLAIMFYAAKEHIRLKNLSSLLHDWQQYIGHCLKRDEAMNKAMRTLKENESISNPAMKSYISELETKQTEILNMYQSI